MVDKAESYFHLAQLFATIAGFFIVGAAIFFGLYGQMLTSVVQTNVQITTNAQPLIFGNTASANQTAVENYKESIISDKNVAEKLLIQISNLESNGQLLIWFGVLFIIASLVVWCYGYSKCKDILKRS